MRLLIACAILVASSSLFAKGGPCKEDRKTHCAGVERGKGRIGQCLFKNWDKVSAPCKAKHQGRFDKWIAKQQACGADVAKFCQNETAGEGRQGHCLRKNKKDLSESCKGFLKERKGKNKAKMASCEKDIAQFCGSIEKGGGATWKCLVANEAQLSEDCKAQWPSLGRRKGRGKGGKKK